MLGGWSPARRLWAGHGPGSWTHRVSGEGGTGEGGNGDKERPPQDVPPSDEGRSGNLGPPPPVFRDMNREGDTGPPPPPYQIAESRQRGGRRLWPTILIAAAALLILFILARLAVGLYVDRLWFDELGFRGVFNTRIGAQVWLFFAGFGVSAAYILGTIALASRLPLEIRGTAVSPFQEFDLRAVRRLALLGAVVGTLFLAVIFGATASAQWEQILQFIHAQPFGVEDAEFNRDVGFYVFKLEPLQFIKGWAVGLSIMGALIATATYGFRFWLYRGQADATTAVRMHLAVLLVIILALFAWGYWLARFELVVTENGTVFGATFTDATVRETAYLVLIGVSGIAALALLSWPLHRRLAAPLAGMGLLAVTSIGGILIYPALIQRFTVEPDELQRERPFIERNLTASRAAFGLDGIEEQNFPAADAVSAQDLADNPEVLRNIRLWDHRPLNDTLNTIQTIRPLYLFPDVDVDRYEINGEERQVFVAAREISQANLQPNQTSWVNRRLQFTHGFGATVSPVDQVTEAGGPEFWVSNIPPELTNILEQDAAVLAITQPRIYFGEATDTYIIVNSDSEEFDFPRTAATVQTGDEEFDVEGQATNRYDGSGGIALGGFFKRLAFAWDFGDTNILISGSVNGDSRIVFRRTLVERVNELTPFLALDADPYLVIGEDGGLFWIQDAYTTTDRYPYSQPHASGINYIRNSVKIVIDAYNGTTDFYIVDDTDPIIRVWEKIFPKLFRPAAEFPATLRPHWRYPQDMFQIQSEQYLTYHIQSARTLFNREDIWQVPQEILRDRQILVEPYYVTLRLPDTDEAEFLLILPFTPRNRTNAIAWLAGRSDGENYGKLFAFRFPANKNVDGPAQIEARIDQDVSISRQFTLLGQRGSEIIRGNLLFIPVGDSFIYVEPIYLQAETTRFPQLKAVVIVNGNRIAMEETLAEASAVALGQRAPTGLSFAGAVTPEEGTPAPAPPAAAPPAEPAEEPAGTDAPPAESDGPAEDAGSPATVAELVAEAEAAFRDAQTRLAAGDFAGYGVQLERLERALERLRTAVESEP